MKTLMIMLSLTVPVAADNAPFHLVPSDCDIEHEACWYKVPQSPVTQIERIRILANDKGVTL